MTSLKVNNPYYIACSIDHRGILGYNVMISEWRNVGLCWC